MPEDKSVKIAEAMQKFVDSQYAVDDPSKGWDCLNSLATFYRELGVVFPDQFEEWTWDNYGKKAIEDPKEAHKAFERFAMTLGEEVNPNYMQKGDLLLVELKTEKEYFGIYAGIYVGRGNAFFMFEKGGRIVPWEVFRPALLTVRRLIK